jgi:hypothetical protein
MKISALRVGDHVQHTGEEIKGHRWIWRGHVVRVTWKYAYVHWTHSNPRSPGAGQGGHLPPKDSRFNRNASGHYGNYENLTRIL